MSNVSRMELNCHPRVHCEYDLSQISLQTMLSHVNLIAPNNSETSHSNSEISHSNVKYHNNSIK